MKTLIVQISFSIFLFFSVSSWALYRCPRQLERVAYAINKRHGALHQQQKKLAEHFKHSVTWKNKSFKPDTLKTIAAAIIRNTQATIYKDTLATAIDELYAVPGFLIVLSRLFQGLSGHNRANFSGALGELRAALEKKKQQKTIIAMGKKIVNKHGRTQTEIDLITQDENGITEWQEVKTRTKLHKNDPVSINAQLLKQRELAHKAKVAHSLIIQVS